MFGETGYDLSEIAKRMREFRDARGWRKFHNPKNLAVSIVLEAAELLELFQWDDGAESFKTAEEKRRHVEEEIADVVLYALSFADVLGIDLEKACSEKLSLNEERYPVDKAYGSSSKYTEL